MGGLDEETLRVAGLYDPGAPDAADRLALLRFLEDCGCTLEEMVDAQARGRLPALAGDRVMLPGRPRYTFDEAALAAGVTVEEAAEVCAAIGLTRPPPGLAVMTEADVDAFATWAATRDLMGAGAALGFVRVVGVSVARIAEAGSVAVRAALTGGEPTGMGPEERTARAHRNVAELVPRLGRLLDLIHRRHIEVARRHLESVTDADGVVVCGIGFTDLDDFTALSRSMPLDKLAGLVQGFEAATAETVQRYGARVVKYIGDAVMFVAPTPGVLADVAYRLVRHPEAAAHGLHARAGIAWGSVVAQDGDYFGTPVNLAARLLTVAGPGEVAAGPDLDAALAAAGWSAARLPEQRLRGFDEPVAPLRLDAPPPVG